ncbi:fasciclin domain-containing protein [Williamsia phyllosphaerae]|uniref:Immunogenic protein MPT70 n=1 Tax=Williamsia phyllosphaerae TaxID=885042 RepID=A0ABQ1UHK6_9NOCA|nr:fasciclin domain-containing protein [Williamsia phyllosphaerae]GGF18318.1 immunogenic protein MPT70 [Williamsia phyllosphaerae]
MPRTRPRRLAGIVVAVGVLVATAGCSDGDSDSSDSAAGPSAAVPLTSVDPSAGLVGPGCGSYMAANPRGAASVDAMALDPVATATANNPLLTQLSESFTGAFNPRVNIADTLNSSQFTLFAPTDAAFAKLPEATMSILKTDDQLLTKVLFYHVIQGQLKPSEITGTHKTVEGQDITVSGNGSALTVDGDTSVICGGIRTSNATVYFTDSVLMPPKS